MKLALLVVLAACGSSPPPAPIASNQCVAVEPSCRTAVEKVRAVAHLREHEVTMAIGECDQQEWSLQIRQCVADSHASADLATCATRFSIAKKGIFREKTSTAAAMKAMTKFRDQMCMCKDSACAQKVSDDMTKWGQEMAKEEHDVPNFSEEDTKAFTELGETMGKCMQQAMSGGTP
jgi:hypothetical protein